MAVGVGNFRGRKNPATLSKDKVAGVKRSFPIAWIGKLPHYFLFEFDEF